MSAQQLGCYSIPAADNVAGRKAHHVYIVKIAAILYTLLFKLLCIRGVVSEKYGDGDEKRRILLPPFPRSLVQDVFCGVLV